MLTDTQILESTYFDLITIYRKVKVKNDITGITETIEVKVIENVKCALSKGSDQLLNVDGLGKLNYTHKLFSSPELDILEGDRADVTSFGNTDSFVVSRPFRYISHKETLLTLKERV